MICVIGNIFVVALRFCGLCKSLKYENKHHYSKKKGAKNRESVWGNENGPENKYIHKIIYNAGKIHDSNIYTLLTI